MSCATKIGHDGCNFNPNVQDRVGHKTGPDSYQDSKNLVYKRKIAAQKRSKHV